ncbi:MAG: hypothetical protein GX557_09155 [Chloroflexi bacterium]|nr:hypothetical protein [Chloroflexota bacterium]
MNSRERFLATARYQQRDRLFQWEMGPYEETIERWQREGLPKDSTWEFYGGYDRYEVVPVSAYLCPAFERETLEETAEYETYRDHDGVIKRKRVDAEPPAMPQYLDYPLKGPEQWPEFSRRLNPASPARFPLHWESMKRDYAVRDYPLGLNCGSLFGWLRNWMGVEGIAIALYDQPALIERAVEEITHCILTVIDRALVGIDYDFAVLWEDMAYKSASLISPAMYRRFFLPHYRRITDRMRQAGVDLFMLDSDGNVEELIPCWLDVGINWIYPMEIAAGMDVVAMRKRFGKDLLIAGGMDKRVMASTKPAIKAMVDAVVPLCQEGGYIPGCDHAMPPDISWENYLYYRELLCSIEV